MATCLFAGVPTDSFSSKLGAMFMNEQFIPSVLVNRLFGPPRHCLGPTNALRASVLSAIGGFEALGPHLADDFMLGNYISAKGLRVVISPYVVRTIVSDSSLAVLWNHELRWHRTIRGVQPAGYAGMFLTYPVPLALLALVFAPQSKRVAALFAALAARIALQRVSARALGVSPAAAWLVLPRAISSESRCGLTRLRERTSAGGMLGCTSNRAIYWVLLNPAPRAIRASLKPPITCCCFCDGDGPSIRLWSKRSCRRKTRVSSSSQTRRRRNSDAVCFPAGIGQADVRD